MPRWTDDEIERAIVCSDTPTCNEVPAPNVLAEMRAAIRAERRAWMARRVAHALSVGGICAGYVSLVLHLVHR
jgi:hypothetical protein